LMGCTAPIPPLPHAIWLQQQTVFVLVHAHARALRGAIRAARPMSVMLLFELLGQCAPNLP